MPGASPSTRRVRVINLNWTPSPEATEVEVLVVTQDDAQHTMRLRSGEVAGFIAMVNASTVLPHDPDSQTLIAANVVGQWLPDDWSGLKS